MTHLIALAALFSDTPPEADSHLSWEYSSSASGFRGGFEYAFVPENSQGTYEMDLSSKKDSQAAQATPNLTLYVNWKGKTSEEIAPNVVYLTYTIEGKVEASGGSSGELAFPVGVTSANHALTDQWQGFHTETLSVPVIHLSEPQILDFSTKPTQHYARVVVNLAAINAHGGATVRERLRITSISRTAPVSFSRP